MSMQITVCLLTYPFEPDMRAELIEWVAAVRTEGKEPDAIVDEPERIDRIRQAVMRIHARASTGSLKTLLRSQCADCSIERWPALRQAGEELAV
jgi:hypothetical protein